MTEILHLSVLRHQPDPPFLLAFISPGPSGAMAWPLLRAYAAERPTVPIYAIFVLDKDPERRSNFEGGYIFWDRSEARAYRSGETPGPPSLQSATVAIPQTVPARNPEDVAYEVRERFRIAKTLLDGAQCVIPIVGLLPVSAIPGTGPIVGYLFLVNMSTNPGCRELYKEAVSQATGVPAEFLPAP